MSIGSQIDEYAKLRKEKAALSKQLDDLNKKIVACEQGLIDSLSSQSMLKASGHLATVSIGEFEIAVVKDWQILYNHIVASGSFELLQKRLSNRVALEAISVNGGLPGTEVIKQPKLSFKSLVSKSQGDDNE